MGRLFSAMLAGCLSLPAVAQTATLALPGGQEVHFPAGGLIGVAGPRMVLTLTRLDDQRCPSQVDCYWEGMIRAVIAVTVDGQGKTEMILCNLCGDGGRTGAVAGYVLRLERLEPEVTVIEALGRVAVLTDYTVLVTVSAEP